MAYARTHAPMSARLDAKCRRLSLSSRLGSPFGRLVMIACVCVASMVAAGPALAATTNASSLAKTGTDTTNGATASATSSTGKAAPGDTLSWVLH